MTFNIGKIMIPPHILKKSESLPHHKSSEQIKKHVEIGYQLIKGVDDYTHLADIVLSHHECFDGTGYPRGLKGLSIPLESRMISIANAFEMMTGKRSYRYTLTKEEAITELRNHKSTQFDPELVEVFINRVINPLEI